MAALEQRRKQPITKKMQGGVLFIKTFEIVIPRFSTIDEDPIYFLLTDADLQGFGGSLTYGHPIPVQHRQKVKRLLNRFHNVKSEDLSEDEEMEDSVMQSDDDMLSQGIPEGDTSTQYGTQMPMSQLPGLTKGNKNDTIGIKMEHSRVMKPDIHPVQALVAALKSKPQRVTAADRSLMPPPAPQKPTVQPTQSAQSRSMSRSASPDEQVQDAEQTEKQSEEISHADNFADDRDEDGPTLIGEDDVIQPERGQDIQDKDLHQDLSTEDKVLENAMYTPVISLVGDSRNLDTTPTSYQVQVTSSFTVPTTNSSIPSVVPTTEKDVMEEPVRKQKEPLIHHPVWNCILPATRSVCRIPQDQADILKKPNSVLPAPIGQRFPTGNVPAAVLTSLSTLVEERHRKGRVAIEGQDDVENDSEDNTRISRPSPDHELGDATSDVLSMLPPPATPDSWPSSPVQPVSMRPWADLPPDSSLPEQDSESDQGRSEKEPGILRSKITELPSSPLATSSPTRMRDGLVDDDSDLEMSVPKAFSDPRRAPSKPSPTPRLNANVDHSNPTVGLSRNVSSSGKPYTHLHLPGSSRPSTSGRIQPCTQPHPPSIHLENDISSSAPVVPCSFEVSPSLQEKAPDNVVAFDGAAESKMTSLPDQEDALAERQIHDEMRNQSSRRSSLDPASMEDFRQREDCPSNDKRPFQGSASATETSPNHRHSGQPCVKREARSPSCEARKRVKKYHSNFHFSQDEPMPHMSQSPVEHYRAQRRQFFRDTTNADDTTSSHRRHASASSASESAGSAPNISPANQNHMRTHDPALQVRQHPDVEETTTLNSPQHSFGGSIPRSPTSSDEHLDISQAVSPSREKDKILHDDHAPLPITTKDIVSQEASHDVMDLDGPVDEQFQVPHFGFAPQPTTKPARRSANGATSVVEETVLPAHSETIPREAQDAATRSNQKNAQDAPATPVRMSSGSETQMTRSPAMESARKADMKAKATAFTKPANGEMGQMEGVSDYKNDLPELSDNGSVHSGRARKRAKTAYSIHSNCGLDSDPGFRANSDDEFPSSHATARRDTGHLANGTKHDTQEEERPKGALIDDGRLRSSMRSRSSAASSPRQIPEGRSSLDRTTRFDQIQTSRAADEMRNLPISQSALTRNTQTTAKGDIMRQFCQAYPEYTGDPKHFANLCGQLVRLQNKMFHPFLWDDYIIQSKTKYVEYLARCAGTGINPLPWDARYMEEVRRPRFTREVMNPVMLDNFFAETRGGHDLERSATPNVMAGIGDDDPFARGDDDSRPGSSKQAPARTGADAIPVSPRRASSQHHQQGSFGSPIEQRLKQTTHSSAAAPPPLAAPATTTPQPPASTTTPHPLPSRPMPPTQGPSTTKPAAAAPPHPPRRPAQSRLPTSSGQPSSSAAKKRPRPPPPVLPESSSRQGKGKNMFVQLRNVYRKQRPEAGRGGSSRAGSAA